MEVKLIHLFEEGGRGRGGHRWRDAPDSIALRHSRTHCDPGIPPFRGFESNGLDSILFRCLVLQLLLQEEETEHPGELG